VALAAVDRLLEGNPRQPEWVDFKKAILYDYGRARLDETQYDDAYRTLSQLAKLDPKYRDAPILLGQARAGAMQMHHNEGIRLYREEQLEAAIAHWRAVLEYDPSHVEARRNIEQAERILRTLRDRQRKP
jgi:tetratricopeptide (TPR) repeat protein